LGTLKRDPAGIIWFVRALDTGRQGDVARLDRVEPRPVMVAEEGKRRPVERKVLSFTGAKRSVTLARLEREYTEVPS
jgi:hypothetical protein